jgi:hypothetical protein
MGRRRRKQAPLGLLLLLVAVAAAAVGVYIQSRLAPYGVWANLATRECGWRDAAFMVALWAGVAGLVILLLQRLVR